MVQAPIEGRIAENIMYFARLVRSVGLAVGPGKVLDAIKAVELVGIGSQDDLYWVLFSLFVNRYDQRELFDQAFHIFWRNPRIMERMMGAMLPTVRIEQDDLQEMSRRLSEAMATGNEYSKPNRDSEQIEFDASFTFCPFLPIARLNCSSGITTSTLFFSSYRKILLTSAGARALAKNVAWFSDQVTISIFSPCSSFTTA